MRDGWHCCDIGSGAGTVVAWMAEKVGPSGRVLSVDVLQKGLLVKVPVEKLAYLLAESRNSGRASDQEKSREVADEREAPSEEDEGFAAAPAPNRQEERERASA